MVIKKLTFIFLWVLSPQRKMNASMLQVKKFLAFACLSLFSLFLFLLDKLGELVVGEVGSGYAAVLYHDVVGNAGQTETGEEGAFHHLAVADNITGRAAAAA